MASDAAGAGAAVAVAVLAILVLSSMGHPNKGPLCSECGSLCNTNCTAEAANSTTCRSYCDNDPTAAREDCERQVLQGCQAAYCSYGTCSRDCNLEAQNACLSIPDDYTDCQACKQGMFQSCFPTCQSNCNSTCVKKEHGC
ncbi:hypothetical protein Zm00014a_032311 [Zea mays]|uniref:Uncharacterized protein n=1 Tax=Zea mays TaxID=4577 RepID=A0A3L6DQS1_MAIZE|nr:hypothetical protein Zm00014a_032311 [Zea mays]